MIWLIIPILLYLARIAYLLNVIRWNTMMTLRVTIFQIEIEHPEVKHSTIEALLERAK